MINSLNSTSPREPPSHARLKVIQDASNKFPGIKLVLFWILSAPVPPLELYLHRASTSSNG